MHSVSECKANYVTGPDKETMIIINRRDNSPETSELVTRRIELTKPGTMRPHWNKNLGRKIYVPRRPEENERRDIESIDHKLKRKERESRIGVGNFRDFDNEAPQRTTQDQHKTNRNETHRKNEAQRDAKSTTSNNSEETVATHELGAYHAIPVQEYRDCPIEEIAVHYVSINHVVEEKAKRKKQQEDDVRTGLYAGSGNTH